MTDRRVQIELTQEMIEAGCGFIRGRLSVVELEIPVEQAFLAMLQESVCFRAGWDSEKPALHPR
tara:strand:- start:11 stop:202 length:192 start_codon:yes stop_codon:yes gene_type:complete